MNRLRKAWTKEGRAGAAWLLALLGGCAADPAPNYQYPRNVAAEQNLAAELMTSARIDFHYMSYYSLTAPKAETGCAGDAKIFYGPFSSDPLAEDRIDPTTTLRPAFIKNVSLDITDANSAATANNAKSCSYGTGESVIPPSNCATFDYGALGGAQSNLGGVLLLLGGLQGPNYEGSGAVSCGLDGALGYPANECHAGGRGLAVESLPAKAATNPPTSLVPGLTSASGPISTWLNLAQRTGPEGLAGASAAYSSSLQKILLVGGSSETLGGAASSASWLFDLASQSWNSSGTTVNVDSGMTTLIDFNSLENKTYTYSKGIGARALSGVVAAQGMAVDKMTSTGSVTAATIDTTDRIITVGGLSAQATLADTRKFNPTYGPEWVNLQSGAAANQLTQWLDSYHTQLMSNSASNTLYTPDFSPFGSPNLAVNFGLAAVSQNDTATPIAGYLVAAGGFDPSLSRNSPTVTSGGQMLLSHKNADAETAAKAFAAITNDTSGNAVAPATWKTIPEADKKVPWHGGVSLLPGFNILENDLVYFGGTTCKDYLTNPSANCEAVSDGDPQTNFDANPGFYWRLTKKPNSLAATPNANGAGEAQNYPFAGTVPKNAGMAATRGLDPSGKVIIVAWGGVKAAATPDSSFKVYYLYNAGTEDAPTPTWAEAVATNPPPPMANASLIFSHVTGDYYMFGGYSHTLRVGGAVNGDTWRLEISSPNNAACNGANCSFRWQRLTGAGLTCSPSSCPSARRSHRMTEVNYANRNPGGRNGSVSGKSACLPSEPCSYGIFMEGGTKDGTNYLADRWMFDPTANGGSGHWQLMTEFPPRKLAAMASVEYLRPASTTKLRRAVLFGGETGLHSPYSASGKAYVPPTLGDTWMYDFDNSSWNRVTLLGKGYNSDSQIEAIASTNSPAEAREAFSAKKGGDVTELSPPPLAGAVMVSRTMSGPSLGAVSPVKPLKIPELYLFGGRKKDGTYLPLNAVYKFCAGTAGEAFGTALNLPNGNPFRLSDGTDYPDDGSCDAFDPVNNWDSPYPTSKYVGRWLRKTPGNAGVDPALLGTYLGAAAYDSYRDRIVLIGGKTFSAPGGAVTDSTDFTASSDILEYTPPSKAWYGAAYATPARQFTEEQVNGKWTRIPACDGTTSPPARYGHSLSFDASSNSIVMVGGLGLSGNALIQQVTSFGSTYEIPDTWKAVRDDTVPCYRWSRVSLFGNVFDDATQAPPFGGLAHSASVLIPGSGYNTGYYTMFDNACEGKGPLAGSDPTITKLMAGGAYFDIDRNALGPNENLLLSVTFLPLGPANQRPDAIPYTTSESAVLKIHLVSTGQSGDAIRQVYQPRYLTYALSEEFPTVARSISIVAPPTGEVRQEQILIPLSLDPSIDRIRLERHSGSAILIDATLTRMGYR